MARRVLMGVRVIAGGTFACMYDSVQMLAFGPVFSHEETFGSAEAAVEDFLAWFWLRKPGCDPRTRANVDLKADRDQWLRERVHGEPPVQARPEDRPFPHGERNAPSRLPGPYTDHFTNTEEDAAAFERATEGGS